MSINSIAYSNAFQNTGSNQENATDAAAFSLPAEEGFSIYDETLSPKEKLTTLLALHELGKGQEETITLDDIQGLKSALQEKISAELADLFETAGIDTTTPVQIVANQDGTLEIDDNHPDKEKIEELLARYPGILEDMDKLAAYTRLESKFFGANQTSVNLTFELEESEAANLQAEMEDMQLKKLFEWFDERHKRWEAMQGREVAEDNKVYGISEDNDATGDKADGMLEENGSDLKGLMASNEENMSQEEFGVLQAQLASSPDILAGSRINYDALREEALHQQRAEAILENEEGNKVPGSGDKGISTLI